MDVVGESSTLAGLVGGSEVTGSVGGSAVTGSVGLAVRGWSVGTGSWMAEGMQIGVPTPVK